MPEETVQHGVAEPTLEVQAAVPRWQHLGQIDKVVVVGGQSRDYLTQLTGLRHTQGEVTKYLLAF